MAYNAGKTVVSRRIDSRQSSRGRLATDDSPTDDYIMFEQIVLIAILRLGDDAYAIPLRQEIEERTGRSVARGALYTALERLEAKQFVVSRMSAPLPERGGRSRRYYAVTPAGLEAIKAARHSLLQLWQGLEGTLER